MLLELDGPIRRAKVEGRGHSLSLPVSVCQHVSGMFPASTYFFGLLRFGSFIYT